MTHLVETWGYWAVALFVLAEALGVPLPGETAVIIAGTYAGHNHHLSPWTIWAVAAVAALVGGQIGFLLGGFGGQRLVRRWGHKIRLDESKLRIGRYLFDTYGSKVVFFGRFVTILRTYVAFLAGTSRMRLRRFALANAAGAVVWAGIVTLVSYLAGNALRRTSGMITWIVIGLAIVVIAVVFLSARRRAEEIAVKAEAAYREG